MSRYLIRQLGKPGLLAATYKGDAAGIAAAAMEEVESTLVSCLHELERLSFISGGRFLFFTSVWLGRQGRGQSHTIQRSQGLKTSHVAYYC